jgi:hypothetical protein
MIYLTTLSLLLLFFFSESIKLLGLIRSITYSFSSLECMFYTSI